MKRRQSHLLGEGGYIVTILFLKNKQRGGKAWGGGGGKVRRERKSTQEAELRYLNKRYFHLLFV